MGLQESDAFHLLVFVKFVWLHVFVWLSLSVFVVSGKIAHRPVHVKLSIWGGVMQTRKIR